MLREFAGLVFAEGGGVSRRWRDDRACRPRRGRAAVLIALELANGALDYESRRSPILRAPACLSRRRLPVDDPADRPRRSTTGGLRAQHEPVRSGFFPSTPSLSDVEWDRETLERAVRAGLLESVDDAEARDSIGALEARSCGSVVDGPRSTCLIEGVAAIGDLFGGIFDRR